MTIAPSIIERCAEHIFTERHNKVDDPWKDAPDYRQDKYRDVAKLCLKAAQYDKVVEALQGLLALIQRDAAANKANHAEIMLDDHELQVAVNVMLNINPLGGGE